jgi:hypothetical protein
MNTIIDGAVVLEIHLILPSLFLGVDETFANAISATLVGSNGSE